MASNPATQGFGPPRPSKPQARGTIKFKVDYPSDDDLSANDNSNASAYGKTRKRKMPAWVREKAKRVRADARAELRYGPAPAAADLSDDDLVEYEDEWWWKQNPAETTEAVDSKEDTQTLVLKDDNDNDKDKGTIIDLNSTLADLLANRSPEVLARMFSSIAAKNNDNLLMDLDGDTVMGGGHLAGDLAKGKTAEVKQISFLDLALETRVLIYRKIFRGGVTVDFEERTNFARSSAVLRTCKQIHEEGRVVLYGENSFHFARCNLNRGKYWDNQWKEIGYKDIRRFFESIGPVNVSHMKYVSFTFTDALNKAPYISICERKYTNDANLREIFHFLSKATLRKLAVLFGGRARITTQDFHFLKAFTELKCHELVFIRSFRAVRTKFQSDLKTRMENSMVIPFDDTDIVHPALNTNNSVTMIWEEPGWASHFPVSIM